MHDIETHIHTEPARPGLSGFLRLGAAACVAGGALPTAASGALASPPGFGVALIIDGDLQWIAARQVAPSSGLVRALTAADLLFAAVVLQGREPQENRRTPRRRSAQLLMAVSALFRR